MPMATFLKIFNDHDDNDKVQLVSKISYLCGPDLPTSQTDRRTDRRTDDMRSQYRALHYSASRGKNGVRFCSKSN